MRNLLTILLLCVIVGLSGCRAGEQTSVKGDSTTVAGNREIALQHYIEGSIYDQKGEYAKAILEYQDALRYDDNPAIYYAISKDYSILGKHSLAARMGEEAVKREPTNKTYRENLAEIYLNAFDVEKAISQYEEIVRLDSTSLQAWYNLARLYQMRKPLRALELYADILHRFGPTWDVYSQMVPLYMSMGKIDEGASALKEMLEMDPSNYELRRTLADAYLRAGKKDEALAVYNELLERDPNDIEVRAAVVHVRLLQERYEEATRQLESIFQSDSLTVETQLRFGQYFASFLQRDSAVAPYAYDIFGKIQRNYPNDWRPYWFLGIIASVMKDDSAAMSNLEQVTRIAPTNPDGWLFLASMFVERGNALRASQILLEAVKSLPDEPRLHSLLGHAYQQMKKPEEALQSFERALELNPKHVPTMSNTALLYDELKRYEDADRLYEEALKLEPDNHLILNNYGYSLADRNLQLERALDMAREAVRQQPENSSYLDTIGWVYFRLGEYVEAERHIRRAVENGDASPIVLEHLGDVYSKMGQKEKAVEYWQKALERDTSNESLRAKIMRGSL
jgi:tetratricopeptide (TPR) repeat protein